ncbi:hypothetical protein E8E13_002106 [Curvularia kusanoi]|uniref:ORC1/DEAH AAA+ ATPase domain-containing protein n=1 Tax=Curvularia kusanoi TaxID=90978 RepID=A0A9P4T3G1_CURKU|nr:hypothetical protein E8E13_002106 [Curvularia kusanoi]
MSIVGLGGTGKTQVALQFAYEVKEAQPDWSIFWVPAVSVESFEQACTEIAAALGIPLAADREEDAKELVKQWLSSGQARRWLLVVDNADDLEVFFGNGQSPGIIDYLPESEGGITVYTTRTLEVAVSLTRGDDVLELGAMDRRDATDFLTKSLIRKALLADQAMTGKLLDELTCLPLAIAQAAAYLNKNRMSISKYVQLLRSAEQDLVRVMGREFRDDTRYRSSKNAVATTWVVSFSQIRKHDTVAADLLGFISCVEWKAIPRSLLPSAESEARLEEAIGTLCGYSFLAKRDSEGCGSRDGSGDTNVPDDDEEWYDVHRLVHLATRIWIEECGDLAKATGDAVRHVTAVFPSDDHENQAVWRAYLPHALRLLGGGRGSNVEESSELPELPELSELCLLVGRCLRVDGRISEAVVWLEKSCQQRRQRSENDLERLSSQHALAMAYQANGQVQKAVELLQHVVEVREKTLSPEHPDRLTSQHVLATAYQADGQVQKAVKLLQHVVEVREKTLSPEHPDRLTSQHALAMASQANGQVQKAVELLEHVVEVQEKTLSLEHPHRLASQHALTLAYNADGQLQEAVDLLERVVEIKTRVLQADHPSLLVSVEALADMRAELAWESDEASSYASLESFTMAPSYHVQQR